MNPGKVVEYMLNDEEPLEPKLQQALEQAGIFAYLEHPGFIAVPTANGELQIGTVDGFWGCDFHPDAPDEVVGPARAEWAKLKDVDAASVPIEDLVKLVAATVSQFDA